LRRLVSLVFALALMVSATGALAQEIDFTIGGNTLWSSQNTTAAVGFLPPAEKGGVYPSASLQYLLPNHLGFNVEGSFRYHRAIYNDFQPYRPFLYDVNAVYAPRFTSKMQGDFMGGFGAQTVLFYNEFGNCNLSATGCLINLNSTHFAFHMGAGIKYYFWRNFFVRPEVHWYYVIHNYQFHSDNVFRIGASIGHTFGR